MNRIIIVAVDGPAGSGKSSVSKLVAMKNNLKYIDSGAIYRAVTWKMLQNSTELSKSIDYGEKLEDLEIKQVFNKDGTSTTFVNGNNVSEDIRTEKITKNIGIISDNVKIRDFVTKMLRSWASEESILMDGRDIGTVVFPSADLKIYLDASVEVRAERRYKEYLEKGKDVDLNDIKKQIILRDEQDKGREHGALQKADDALYLDTSSMSKDDVIEKFNSIIDELNI